MATLKEQREAAAAKANAIAEGAKAAGRQLSSEEVQSIRGFVDEIKNIDTQMKDAQDAQSLLDSIGSAPEVPKNDPGAKALQAMGLGQHFAKSVGAQLLDAKGKRFSVSAPEYGGAKAATDPHLTTDFTQGILRPEYDNNIVHQLRRRLTVADWLGAGTLTSNAITYFVESADVEGAITTVAEGAAKPQLHFPDYDPVTETLKKIAGWIKISDEMTEDAAFLVSEIENRLIYQLLLFEEDQLLNGNGTGTNVLGLLNRVGLQTETATTAVDGADNADAVFRAMTKVQTGAQMEADGILMHPLDYQKFRLMKDGNGQYFGGGFFQGQYGNNGIQENPPLWGLRTIVTPAIAQGTVVLGAGKQAATVYRKGGLRVEATNTEGNDFTENKVTIRAEERVTLAVRRPAAFVKVTLNWDAAPAA